MTVETVFEEAKQRFVYLSDKALFGVDENWQLAKELEAQGMRGDCEDFSAWCVYRLRQQGLPARYVFCQVETGEYHCVAECGGEILDNRQAEALPFARIAYTWISISGYKAGDPWHRIKS